MMIAIGLLADDAPRDTGPDFGKASPFGLVIVVLLLIGTCFLLVAVIQGINSLIGLPQRAREWRTARRDRTGQAALREALAHRSYIYLILGYFTCGFQVFFITVHLPAYLVDRGLGADIGAWTIGFIGLFNIIGSLSAGWISGRMPKRTHQAESVDKRAKVLVANGTPLSVRIRVGKPYSWNSRVKIGFASATAVDASPWQPKR